MQEIKWTPKELKLLKASSCILRLPSHKIIFNEDSQANYIYYVKSGHIKHYHNTATGKEIIVSIYCDGEIIGFPPFCWEKPAASLPRLWRTVCFGKYHG